MQPGTTYDFEFCRTASTRHTWCVVAGRLVPAILAGEDEANKLMLGDTQKEADRKQVDDGEEPTTCGSAQNDHPSRLPPLDSAGTTMKTISLRDGAQVSVLGQGTWKMGEGERDAKEEANALRLGIDLGMTLLDTAEMYADGRAEEVVAEAIRGQRERVFLVTKVYPHNASRKSLPAACERSLRRLGTDTVDLYLLHWRGRVPLAETVEAFERLREAGKVRAWGVSNFDVDDLEELGSSLPGCATDQILYNPEYRGPEFDLLPWSQAHRLPIMAYSPVGQGGSLLRHRAIAEVARRHDATPAQVCLAWVLRQEGVIAIPKASDTAHVRANAAALDLRLDAADLRAIDAAFPAPTAKSLLALL